MTHLRELVFDPKNARQHNPRNIGMIAESLQKYGPARSIVIDEDNVILAGNGVVEAAMQIGVEHVRVYDRATGVLDPEPPDGAPYIFAVRISGLTPIQKAEYGIADNRTTDLSTWDQINLASLADDGVDLSQFWFEDELSAVLAGDDEPVGGLTDPDDVPDVPSEPVTKRGDLWLLGRHRLLCGDSTVVTDVDRLMDGKKADMVFTDPPWNVAYGENMPSNNAQGCKVRTIMNDKMGRVDWGAFLSGVASSLLIATKPGALLYCVMGSSEWPGVDAALRAGGFHWSSTIIWVKDQLVLSRKDYHTQYEPIWYGWNESGPRLIPLEDRKQSDVWNFDRPKVSDLHPTTKPVELVERAVQNSSKAGDVVLDLFLGSGSTLIACEQTNRTCFGMELDGHYVDVIIKRWQDFTGQTATLADETSRVKE